MAKPPLIFTRGTGRGRNVNTIVSDYKQFIAFKQRDIRRILNGAGDIILNEVDPLVPRDTEALASTGTKTVEKTAKGLRLVISYGGESRIGPTKNTTKDGIVDYALIVHETQFKYLEVGAMAARPKVDAFIKNELKKVDKLKRPRR